MESYYPVSYYLPTVAGKSGMNKVEFHAVRPVYPIGEQIKCSFYPVDYKPESGDWIGIYPVRTRIQPDLI
jgi:hypothetical protein